MEPSVLLSTKAILGIAPEYTAFDLDILTHINAAFSFINQLGVGPAEGVFVEDESYTWDLLALLTPQLSLVKTYVFLRVKSIFDPPPTSFAIQAMERQIQEQEWRLNVMREELIAPPVEETILVLDGGEV